MLEITRISDALNRMERGFSPFAVMENCNPIFPVNSKEVGEEFIVEALLPGVAKKDISITTDDGRLTITANMQNEDEDVKHHLKEFSRTSKSRSFILPDEIDAACISASCCDGVLTLTLPKKKKKEAKKIQID